MRKNRIVLIATSGITTNLLYNELIKENDVHLIIEEKISPWIILRNRLKKLGLFTVFGQVLFILFEKKILQKTSKKRINTLTQKHLGDKDSLSIKIEKKISSINSSECQIIVKEIDPDLIILNGTRIASEFALKSFNKKIINVHTGITPKYRGVHGGYWALVNKDSKNFGTTVHFVNKGIDTGNVIYQVFGKPSSEDSFSTYPVLQYSLILGCLNKVVDDVIKGKSPSTFSLSDESNLYYHPTLWGYLYNRAINKVK